MGLSLYNKPFRLPALKMTSANSMKLHKPSPVLYRDYSEPYLGLEAQDQPLDPAHLWQCEAVVHAEQREAGGGRLRLRDRGQELGDGHPICREEGL